MSSTVPEIGDRERLTIVLGALVVLMLAALDQTIVSPALPTIGASLGDVEYLSWIVSAYFLTSTAVTPLYGKLADLKGRRPTLYAAITIFSLGSILCALAPNMGFLILGRAVQGLGGGGLITLVQTVIGDVVSPRERGRYMGWISLVWATASVSGPIVGGVFAQHLHWSLIFWINLPLAAVALAMIHHALRRLPDVRRPQRLDLVGAVLVVGGTVALMLALTWGGARMPWGSPTVLSLLAGAFVCVGGFAWHIARVEDALIPLSILRNPVVAVTTSAMFFIMGGWLALSVYVPIWLQEVHGFGAADAGFGLIPLTLGTVLGANLSGRAMMRVTGYKLIAQGGSGLAVVSMVTLALASSRLPLWGIEGLLALTGLGCGVMFPISTVAVQNAVERRDLGVATATHAFLRSLGSVVVVAALGAILIGSGLGEVIEAGRNRAPTPDEIALAETTYGWIFAGSALALFIGFVILAFLEERPLGGRAAPSAEEA